MLKLPRYVNGLLFLTYRGVSTLLFLKVTTKMRLKTQNGANNAWNLTSVFNNNNKNNSNAVLVFYDLYELRYFRLGRQSLQRLLKA